MRINRVLLLILIIGFLSCNKVEKTNENRIDNNMIVIEKMPDQMPNLNYIRKDDSLNAALIVSERTSKNLRTQEIDFLGLGTYFLTNCDCELDSGELKIKISNNGGWIYRELSIDISDTILVNHLFANDIIAKTTSPQYFRIEVNNLKPVVSDTIYGKIISIHDTIHEGVKVINDTGKVDLQITEKYLGHFRCKVRK